MRKFIAASVAALSLAAVTATTAGAQTVSTFKVQTVRTATTHHGTREIGRLTEPFEPSETVGFYKVDIRSNHLRAVARFPDGKIKLAGAFRNGNFNKLHILGGTGRWNGASGKVLVHNLPGPNVILTFTVVQ